jgi:adenylate kinase
VRRRLRSLACGRAGDRAAARQDGGRVEVNVVVLLGAPGAGKGTQAPLLAEHLGLPIVATGDLFRAAVRDGTPLGLEARRYMDAGQLVPDAITVRLLLERLARPDAEVGVILDGFPRTGVQARALDEALAERGSTVCAAVLVEVPEDELIRRLSGRWICRASGHPYHEVSSPPRVAGVCDLDGSELYQRNDDRPETIRARMAQQLGYLDEVVSHYRASGVLRAVDGLQPIGAVAAAVATAANACLVALRPIAHQPT